MTVLVTGQDTFVGRNLTVRLSELPAVRVVGFDRGASSSAVLAAMAGVTAVIHLDAGRRDLAAAIGDAARAAAPPARVFDDADSLPHVFGKWASPADDPFVARVCDDAAHGRAVRVDDPERALALVYVDDLIDQWVLALNGDPAASTAGAPVYRTTAGALAARVETYRGVRQTLVTERVGTGFDRALYSTYVSYLPPDGFAYPVPMHADARGVFVEFLKTQDAGQFSFFIAKPGVTRGGHYHHTKTEKFLVVQGRAVFRFRHIVTNDVHEVAVSGDASTVVETVPGWAHDITNVGDEDLVVILWANEVFDRARPDTVVSPTR